MITASQVKDLREKTGAGMMDCKKVLTETDGDMEKAIELLREKLMEIFGENANCRFIAVDILGGDTTIFNSVKDNLEIDLLNNEDFIISLNEAKSILPSEDTINSERVLKAEEIAKRGKKVIIAGGTGLYINSFLDNIEFF